MRGLKVERERVESSEKKRNRRKKKRKNNILIRGRIKIFLAVHYSKIGKIFTYNTINYCRRNGMSTTFFIRLF